MADPHHHPNGENQKTRGHHLIVIVGIPRPGVPHKIIHDRAAEFPSDV